jgi:hypothetical protein
MCSAVSMSLASAGLGHALESHMFHFTAWTTEGERHCGNCATVND